MRLVWDRAVRKPDQEFVWLIASAALLTGGATWLAMPLPWPSCPFLSLTGWPCLTCGATRCLIALMHGNFLSAVQWNPLIFVALLALIAFDLYAAIVVVGRLPRLRIVDWTSIEKKVTRIIVISLLAMNWIYLLAYRDQF